MKPDPRLPVEVESVREKELAAPSDNSVDTPAPVPERTKLTADELCDEMGIYRPLAAPVPEPEPRHEIASGRDSAESEQNKAGGSGHDPSLRNEPLALSPKVREQQVLTWLKEYPSNIPYQIADEPESEWDYHLPPKSLAFMLIAFAESELSTLLRRERDQLLARLEASAKEDAMADFRSWYTQEGSAKFDEISQRHYEPDDCTDTQLIMQEVAELTWARARLGLSGRAE